MTRPNITPEDHSGRERSEIPNPTGANTNPHNRKVAVPMYDENSPASTSMVEKQREEVPVSELTPAHLHVPALPTTAFGDGRDWIDALQFGWKTVPSWGLGMWDLGQWPLVIVVHLDDRRNGVFAVASYTEGDIERRAFTDPAERDAATDEIAAAHWRLHGGGPFDLPPEGEPLLPHHKGLFTWDRYREEKDQLPEPKEENR